MTHAELRQYFYSRLSTKYLQGELQALYHWCVQEIHQWSRPEAYLHNEVEVEHEDKKQWMVVLDQLEKGIPVQHVFGVVYFAGLQLKCDNRALIPRPETEELVAIILQRETSHALNVADLGCGSGCIALALKSEKKNWKVSGYDKSEAALDLAKSNAEFTGLDVSFYHTDLAKQATLENMDIIVSNPPYIPPSMKHTVDDHVVKFEPEMALFSPVADPYFFFVQIVKLAKKSGIKRIYLETHGTHTEALIKVLQPIWGGNFELVNDLSGKPRFVILNDQ